MNYYTYEYTNKNGETKELHLRLTSADAMQLEKAQNVKILQYLQDESLTMVITMLRYMNRVDNKNFSLDNAQALYDELIDSGLTLKRILVEIIYETLVVSGFLEKGEWEEMKKAYSKMEQEKHKVLENI